MTTIHGEQSGSIEGILYEMRDTHKQLTSFLCENGKKVGCDIPVDVLWKERMGGEKCPDNGINKINLALFER